MRLKIMLPSQVLVDTQAAKVVAEAANGSFCLEPRHADFVTALVPGVLAFDDAQGREHLLAVDEGVLVKRGEEVMASTMGAVEGDDLAELRRAVEERFLAEDEREKKARTAMAKMEAGLIRRLMELR